MQVSQLKRLHNGDLPFSERTMGIVRDIMISERTQDHVIRPKTG